MRSLLHPNININKRNSPRNLNQWKRCGIIFTKMFNEQKHILVVKGSSSGIWSLPKGRINESESEYECARREVWEETGILIDVDVIKTLPRICIDYNVYFIYDIDTINSELNLNVNFNIQDTYEVCEVSWKNFNELVKLHCNKDIRNLLKKSYQEFNNLNTTLVY